MIYPFCFPIYLAQEIGLKELQDFDQEIPFSPPPRKKSTKLLGGSGARLISQQKPFLLITLGLEQVPPAKLHQKIGWTSRIFFRGARKKQFEISCQRHGGVGIDSVIGVTTKVVCVVRFFLFQSHNWSEIFINNQFIHHFPPPSFSLAHGIPLKTDKFFLPYNWN